MFNNHAQFNQLGFNSCSVAELDHSMRGIAGLVITGRVRAGTDYLVGGTASLVFYGAAEPARGWRMRGDAGVQFSGAAKITRLVAQIGSGEIVFTGAAKARADHRGGIRPVGGLVFGGAAKARADHNGGIRPVGGLRFAGNVKPRMDVVIGDSLAGVIFTGTAEVKLRSEESFSLSITLAPGQSIVVDTENYTVTRSGVNVISSHSGAWPQLQRNSAGLEIVANGPTTTQIIYQEQWL